MEQTPKKFKYNWPIVATLSVIGGQVETTCHLSVKRRNVTVQPGYGETPAEDHPADANPGTS